MDSKIAREANRARAEQPRRDDAGSPHLLLTVEEAAEQLMIGRSRMYELIKDGSVASICIGRLRRVPPSALSDFIEHQLAVGV